jgi:hypothetical protein
MFVTEDTQNIIKRWGSDWGQEENSLKLGYLSAVCNYILMTHQATFMDNHPKVMILPCLPADEIWSWNGRRFQALCICADEEVYRANGACRCDESPLIGESSIMCNDERVQIALDGFRDVIKVVLLLIQSEESLTTLVQMMMQAKKSDRFGTFFAALTLSRSHILIRTLKGWSEWLRFLVLSF